MSIYRSEIDGLRAIAVLSVMLFHAGFGAFSGGFVGVDVFFVISGFLITNILVTENHAGTFSFAKFYERRARRILPALYFVILICFPIAFATMLPDELLAFARSVVATTFFGANVYFWRNTDYFDADPESNPLLHMWSLAVEEQYYVIFPIALMLLWRFGIARITVVLVVATLASLGLSELGWRLAPSANFFLLPTRAWELGIGAITTLVMPWVTERRGQYWRDACSATGLAAIFASIFLFDEATPFPGLLALFPTLGTALVILCGTGGTWVARALSLRPIVGVGLISYSAYLWHQPVLVFARAEASDLAAWQTGALLLLSLALAWFTWRAVERPFRDRRFLNQSWVFGTAAVASLVILASASAFALRDGFRAGYPEQVQQFVGVPNAARTDYVRRAYAEIRDADFTEDGRERLLLIGDSFSQDFYNMIVETGAFANFEIAGRHIRARCQIHGSSEDVLRFIEPTYRQACAREPNILDLGDEMAAADVVILASEWTPWAAERLPDLLYQHALIRTLRPNPCVLSRLCAKAGP